MNIINNILYLGEIPASHIAKKYSTPVYAYDEDLIRHKYRELSDSFSYQNISIYYSAGANANLRILKIIKEEGGSISASSPGEITAALEAGFTPSKIMFTATSVSDEELLFAIRKKVLVNIDSLSQLERYGKLNPKSSVCLRLNSAATSTSESKLGIWFGELPNAMVLAKKHELKIIGLHHHVGSEILNVENFLSSTGMILAAAKSMKGLEFINFGGGIGVPCKPGQAPFDVLKFGEKISSTMENFSKNYGSQLRFIFEPGRYLVAEAGALLCTVNTIKTTPKHKFIGVDTGFNHLPLAYHQIINIENAEPQQTENVSVVGNICDANDLLATDRTLPLLKEGDVLAIMATGAYGYSMASNYNNRPRPVEILVSGKKMTVIRPAEKIKDIV